jgi:hypothetical protein
MTTSPSGTGIGVNLSAVPASNTDLQANAQTENAKNALAMIADSLKTVDVSFVEHRPYSYDNHTSSPAVTPARQHIRLGTGREEASTEAWQEKYQSLVDQMPEEVKKWFQEQFKYSYYYRDLEFFALHALLAVVADGLVWLDQIMEPKPTTSLFFERAKENQDAPFIAVQTAMKQGREAVQRGNEMWQEIGRDDPNFDKNFNYLKQTDELLQTLENVVGDLALDPSAPGAKELLNQLASQVKLLKEEYWETSRGPQLQNLGFAINTLANAISILQTGYGKASAYWTLALGTTSYGSGPAIQSLIQQLSGALATSLNEANKEILNRALLTLFTITIATTLGVAERGLPALPQLDKESTQALKSMTLRLTTQFIIRANLLQNMYRNLAAQIAPDEKTQSLIQDSATLSNLCVMVMAPGEKEGLSEMLFHALRNDLLPLVEKVAAQMETAQDPKLAPVKIYLQQAKIALENDRYDGFSGAYRGLLDSLNLSSMQLNSEIEEINQLGSLIREAVRTGPDDATNKVTIIRAA